MFTDRVDVFKAMGSDTRQLILRVIEKGVKNPSRIARELGMPRSTVEKHLRVMLKAGVVNKVPVLNEHGRLGVRYELLEIAYKLKDAVQEL